MLQSSVVLVARNTGGVGADTAAEYLTFTLQALNVHVRLIEVGRRSGPSSVARSLTAIRPDRYEVIGKVSEAVMSDDGGATIVICSASDAVLVMKWFEQDIVPICRAIYFILWLSDPNDPAVEVPERYRRAGGAAVLIEGRREGHLAYQDYGAAAPDSRMLVLSELPAELQEKFYRNGQTLTHALASSSFTTKIAMRGPLERFIRAVEARFV